MDILPFKEIVTSYSTVFFDAFGVLKNHRGILPGIQNTFKFLGEQGIDYFIVTNDASRSPSDLAQSYQQQGLHMIVEEKIVSSGMLAQDYLSLKVRNGKVAYLGGEKSAYYIKAAGLEAINISDVDLAHCDDINALVFMDDEGYEWYEGINKAVNLLRQINIPVIVSNTDKSYPVSSSEVAIATGGLANMVQDIVGKTFVKFGKPDSQIFVFAMEHSIEQGGTADKNKILMVGDTLATDILGANKFGLDTLLVLTGNTLKKHMDVRIGATGIIPTYVSESVLI